MIISYRKKFLFLHTPKTGGTAIADRILPYARLRDRLAYHRRHPIHRMGRIFYGGSGPARIERLTGVKPHASLEDGEKIFGRARLEPLYKFGIVRNPYARTYSLYKFIVNNKAHPLHELIKTQSLEAFVDYICKHRWALQRDRFTWSGEEDLSVDFIGHYERFDEACETLAKTLKINALAFPHRLNASEKAEIDYARLFHNVRDTLVERYRPDFEVFHYSLDPADALLPPDGPTMNPG